MPALTKRELHARILIALGLGQTHESSGDVPLLAAVPTIVVPLAIWAFTLTDPPGGRHPSESKIQLIMPGQNRRGRGNLEGPTGRFKLLVGVHPSDDLFVLWDAYMQKDFGYSKNVQVRGPLLWDASVSGIASGVRRLASGPETVIVARADHLVEAVKRRIGSA